MENQARNAYAKQYKQQHREQIREYNRKYKLENREHVLAVQRILNHKNYYANKSKSEPKPKPEPEKIVIERGSFFVTF
jgi:hypothetical protein